MGQPLFVKRISHGYTAISDAFHHSFIVNLLGPFTRIQRALLLLKKRLPLLIKPADYPQYSGKGIVA
jgi:hypothetical protein